MLYCRASPRRPQAQDLTLLRLHIHLIAIGGTGMAPLAGLLQAEGHVVGGSDAPLYPPMSTLLERIGIRPQVGYDPAHLEPRPDLVVVGNAVRRDNPEAVAAEQLGLPRLSMPEALARFFLADRRPLVVAGTHGKTTTSTLAAFVLADCGRDPSYLVGGLPMDLPESFHRGQGDRFVVEGDEYNAAYFDRGAKFLHYRPQGLILTSVEYDHADLYPSPEALRETYARLIDLVPESGFLVACGDHADVRALAGRARCPVIFYGLARDNEVRFARPPWSDARGTHFTIADPEAGPVEATLGVWGEHNAENALAVWAAARRDGLAPAAIAGAFARFRGVRRRQEWVGEVRGIAVIDDFAHHPTAVGRTLESLRVRFPGRRLVACFEPRSLTAGRAFFLDGYRAAFRAADRVLFAPTFHRDRLLAEERLDFERLAAELTAAGTPASAEPDLETLLAHAAGIATPGDVLVAMSSGSFGGLPRRLLAALAPGSPAS